MGELKRDAMCAWCVYARDREDICGTYCTGGFDNKDGTCDRYKGYGETEEQNDGGPNQN